MNSLKIALVIHYYLARGTVPGNSIVLAKTRRPIMTLFVKTNPILCVFSPKTVIWQKNEPKTNPIYLGEVPIFLSGRRRILSRRSFSEGGQTQFYPGVPLRVAAFRHAVYSMAKNVSEK
jgi:hypothetical protein